MRALTVRQPWAWAIIHGGKDVENRSQLWKYRGPLAIHAGLARFEQDNMASRAHRAAHGSEVPTELVFGAIIGVVDLVDVHYSIECCDLEGAYCSPWAEASYHEDGGRTRRDIVHLVRDNPRPLAVPIACKGRLGLWTPTDEILEQLQAVA